MKMNSCHYKLNEVTKQNQSQAKMTNKDPDTANIKSIRKERKALGWKVTLWITPKGKENRVKSRSSSLKKLRGAGFPTMVEKKQGTQTEEKFQINSVQLQNSQQKHKIKRNVTVRKFQQWLQVSEQ